MTIMMGKAIQFHRKPILILILASVCIILWMTYGKPKKIISSSERGLKANGMEFTLDGEPFRILSGAMHYFRIVPEYWEDRLLKLKAMGLNTVETYVAWNLHEEVRGRFNFNGGLDIVKFVETAKKHDLYVIIRPGPYICAEWDLGGLPSWLLHDPKQHLRSLYLPFITATLKFFGELIPRLEPLQHSVGGPIIAWQVENEYLSYSNSSAYMQLLKKGMRMRGVSELLLTSDGLWNMRHVTSFSLPGVLKTVNFQRNESYILDDMRKLQPDKPLMVTEFWSGWFDHWGEDHHILSVDKTAQRVANILDMKASINFYMFHGGTNFGFMNGANAAKGLYKPTITSYDYDAPLSEAGDITPKYKALRMAILRHAPGNSLPKKMLQSIPANTEKTVYEPVEMQHFMTLDKLLTFVKPVRSKEPLPMEYLPINNNGGQGYGFVLYQTEIPHGAKKIRIKSYRDRAQVLYNAKEMVVPEPMVLGKKYLDENKTKNVDVNLMSDKTEGNNKLQILVENMGRVNFLQEINKQRKGILGDVLVDGKKHSPWKIYPLDFKPWLLDKLTNAEWGRIPENRKPGPGLYRGSFHVDGQPKDTYVLMSGWGKGVCFINGRNLGRYWRIGPQHTLYLPAPWLRKGVNVIVLFEQEGPTSDLEVPFVTVPRLGTILQERL